MIILRQKEYSKKTKVLYALEALRNNAEVAGSRVNTAIVKAVKGPSSPEAFLSDARTKMVRKTKGQLKRQAIIDKNKIKHALSKEGLEDATLKVKAKAAEGAISTLDKANKGLDYLRTHSVGEVAADIPEKILDKGIIATTGTVGGYVMPAVGGPFIPGTTAGSIAAEKAVREAIPGYAKASEKLARSYKKGKLKKVIQATADTLSQSMGG